MRLAFCAVIVMKDLSAVESVLAPCILCISHGRFIVSVSRAHVHRASSTANVQNWRELFLHAPCRSVPKAMHIARVGTCNTCFDPTLMCSHVMQHQRCDTAENHIQTLGADAVRACVCHAGRRQRQGPCSHGGKHPLAGAAPGDQWGLPPQGVDLPHGGHRSWQDHPHGRAGRQEDRYGSSRVYCIYSRLGCSPQVTLGL